MLPITSFNSCLIEKSESRLDPSLTGERARAIVAERARLSL
jgi:hypothetical protein